MGWMAWGNFLRSMSVIENSGTRIGRPSFVSQPYEAQQKNTDYGMPGVKACLRAGASGARLPWQGPAADLAAGCGNPGQGG